MPFPSIKFGRLALWLLPVCLAADAAAQPPMPPKASTPAASARWTRRHEPMVEVTKFCRGIFVELRYATDRNFTGRQIYPSRARCLLRRSVAERLQRAHDALRQQGLGLKVWDAYRPKWAHELLWAKVPNPEFVAAPSHGGSWHSWGASVDVTLVDRDGRERRMPTDFDDFTPAAKSEYLGGDRVVATNVKALRTAMKNAGFKGLRDEWWHFTAEDANQFSPVDMPLEEAGKY